VTKAVG